MSLRLVIIDYDIGNVRSILNAFEKVDISPILSRDKDEILNADGVILPGVGAFSHAMKNLHNYTLVDTLKEYALLNKPLLGICLGMQILFDESEEFEITKGLGIISGKVVKLTTNKKKVKLPHISWNEIEAHKSKWDNTILDNIGQKSDMYFIHSYMAVPSDTNNILSTTNYFDHHFCSSVKKGNIYGSQFHPEKSAKEGLKIIKNFINIVKRDKNV